MTQENQTADLQRELARQITLLRGDFQETVERYRTSVEAEMVNLIDLLSARQEEQTAPCNDVETLRFLLELIKTGRYRKDKGRLKDLRRIHELVKTLSDRLAG